MTKPVADRLRELEENLHEMVAAGAAGDCLNDIRAEVESVASEMWELRQMDPTTDVVAIVQKMANGVIDWSNRLAREKP